MTTPREVERSKILETALQLVGSAQTSVQVTMQVVEELEQPLPRDYFLFLEKKLHEGVTIERIGFGTQEEFEKIGPDIHPAHSRYTFYRTDAKDYRRMILVDGTKLMFAKTDDTGRHVFYTDSPDIVAEYRPYFQAQKELALAKTLR